MSVTLKDIYWAAAYIEGEGSFSTPGNSTARVRISSTDIEPLEKMKSLFGGSISIAWKGRKKPKHWKMAWCWCVAGARAAGLQMTILPLMFPRRKAQILSWLYAWRAARPHYRYVSRCKYGHSLEGRNIYFRPDGKGRDCVACRRIRSWKFYGKRQNSQKPQSSQVAPDL